MSSDEKMNHSCRITGLLSSLYTAQHAILTTLSLYLLLCSAIPSVGAQTPNGTGSDPQYPYTKFSPSMAIIIVVLIAALFIMAFFSIYIRSCSGNPGNSVGVLAGIGASMRGRRAAAASRGLDPEVIETFPTFAYSVVKGLKIGKGVLECAVCLNEFEDDETLRLIPKCDHVFHPECIDEWLSSHVTCPVCRANLVLQPGESLRVPNLEAEPSHIALEVENTQNGDGSLPVIDDHDVNIPQPQVVDRNKSVNQNRPPRSRSVRARLFGKFPRSHSTGHSLVQPGENTDRFTLRLPDDVRKQVMNRALNRTTSCVDRVAVLPREGSSRRGYRTGGEGSSKGRRYRRLESLDRVAKSDRWVFSIAPPFLSRESSVRSPKVVAADGEGTSVPAVKIASNGLDRKSDDADSARPPV